ncbi:MAG TPA: 3-carboxy-cis,cis-muconate cycloisomerase [Actinomycetes bacterium]|nr:3-carboxy-cis,cis-muconate cycloisomerase [Actinomycetes bacterium]
MPDAPSAAAGGLFGGVFARGPVAARVGDQALLQALLDAEAALARASAAAGVVPTEAAEAIAGACDAGGFDAAALGRQAAAAGNPVVPLVRALAERLPDGAARHVHQGATSQDVLDTALMLVAGRALGPLLEDLAAAADACARLAAAHRGTVLAGRTLLQQAVPVTFGLKAAGWLAGLDDARRELAALRRHGLAVQLGGAAGTLAALGGDGLAVLGGFARELGLAEPALPWHTDRTRPARLAAELGVAAGVLGKLARDVTLLAQTEVAEVAEGGEGRGGSSAMPHKRNPVAAVAVVACAARVPGLVATVLAAMVQEHERAAGAWHAEWEPLTGLLRLVGSAASWARELLDGLQVDAGRMRANLDAAGGLLMAESVTAALAEVVGRPRARELVERASRRAAAEGRPLRAVVLEAPEVAGRLGEAGVDAALDPAAYLGAAGELVDRALAAHDRLRTPEERQ